MNTSDFAGYLKSFQALMTTSTTAMRISREAPSLACAIKNGVQSRYTAKEVIEKIKEAEEAGAQHIWMPQIGPLDTRWICT